jgi:hypothetical protein
MIKHMAHKCMDEAPPCNELAAVLCAVKHVSSMLSLRDLLWILSDLWKRGLPVL